MSRHARGSCSLLAQLALYNLALLLALPFLALWLLWRLGVRRKPIGRLRERLGFIPPLPAGAPCLWLHAVSAGEVGAVIPVLRELRARLPQARLVVSTHTDTGLAIARQQCPEADVIFQLPFDLLCSAALALRRVRPDILVVVEKELWPNLLGLARLRGVPVVTVNGRVSDRMLRRGRLLPAVVRWLYRMNDLLCLQSEEDAARLRVLGLETASSVLVAGNTKADTLGDRDHGAEARLRAALAVSEDEIWFVAGSTHAGEEEQVVEAFLQLREAAPQSRLLLAPRHPERLPEVSALLAQRVLQVVRRSEGRRGPDDVVVVLDTMGELRAAYGLATLAFVGGTLVPVGGHNLLEPAASGVPVLFGPHTENCADMAELILAAGAGVRVTGAGSLAHQLQQLAANADARAAMSQAGRALVQRLRGASRRCTAAILELLGEEGA